MFCRQGSVNIMIHENIVSIWVLTDHFSVTGLGVHNPQCYIIIH